MSYEKRTWKIGEEITADKLNHMEDGIAAGGSGGGSETLVVNTTESGGVLRLDKTWQEIYDAFPNVSVKMVSESSYQALYVSSIGSDSGSNSYSVTAVNVSDENSAMEFVTHSADGYPSLRE